MGIPDLVAGDPVEQYFRKYDGTPHWHFTTTYLGSDEHGVWVGGAPGDAFERPGRRFFADAHYVTLIPADSFVATFNEHGGAVHSRIYVDLTTPPVWEGRDVHAVDLDLDVVRRFTGEMRIEDEGEFLDHGLAFGYPPSLVESVRRTADDLLTAIREEREPFGRVGPAWLARCVADIAHLRSAR